MEQLIIVGLMTDEEFGRHVVPHFHPEYFKSPESKIAYERIRDYYLRFDKRPTKTEIKTELDGLTGKVSDDVLSGSYKMIDGLSLDDRQDPKWLREKTEIYAKDRAFELALGRCLAVINGDDKKVPKEALPDMMMDALGVNFDPRVGHDYFEDMSSRWEFYHSDVERVPFSIGQFNEITNGGLPRKTLTIPVAGTNVGKSLFLCDFAANCLRDGRNVLYVSFEMGEEQVAQRVDSNLLKVKMDDVERMSQDSFESNLRRIQSETGGQLVVREYPNKSASTIHIRKLVRDLKMTKRFVPDVILVDYLNICGSSTVKGDVGLYQYAKAVAEELRALAQELDVPIIAPTQTNRGGQSNSDVGLEDVAESHGTSQTADFIFAMIRTENLRDNGRILIKQLKNRFGNVDNKGKFLIGVDMDTMSLYQVDDEDVAPQNNNHNPGDGSVFDSSSAGSAFSEMTFGEGGLGSF